MKKSHRKDVILARLVFTVFCLLLAAAVVGAVMLVKKHYTSTEDTAPAQGSESLGQIDVPVTEELFTEPTQEPEPEPNPIMQTTTGVNLRSEPNTDCEVLTVLEEGTQLELLGEENGWAFVDYRGQTGYVSADYLEEITAETGDVTVE